MGLHGRGLLPAHFDREALPVQRRHRARRVGAGGRQRSGNRRKSQLSSSQELSDDQRWPTQEWNDQR
jgi:hypothetical protein